MILWKGMGRYLFSWVSVCFGRCGVGRFGGRAMNYCEYEYEISFVLDDLYLIYVFVFILVFCVNKYYYYYY